MSIDARFANNTVHGSVSRVNADNVTGDNNVVNSHLIQVQGDYIVNSPPSDAEREAAADWLSPLDFSAIQAQQIQKHTPNTLQWAVNSPQLEKWRIDRGGFLWCPGPPGAGKTIFASFVIDLLQKSCSEKPPPIPAICYIFCQYKAQFTVLDLFEAILKQLILCCPSMDMTKVKEAKSQRRRLPLNEVTSILQSNFTRFPGMAVLVDALDECFSETDRHQLLQELKSFRHVNVLVTSRELPSIETALEGVPQLRISAVEKDIDTHLHYQSQHNPQFKTLLTQVSEIDVRVTLSEKSSGMFLLAHRHITHLADQTNKAAFIEALDTLPTDAAASHASALGRIQQQRPALQQLAYIVLSLISFAVRPFLSIELRYAAANIRLEGLAQEDDLTDEGTMVSACAGLVAVNGSSQEIGFIHYTVQEYLEQIRYQGEFPSEAQITASLMNLISQPGIQLEPPSHRLIEYAAISWGRHMQRCEQGEDVGIVELAVSFVERPAVVQILGAKSVLRSVWSGRDMENATGHHALHLLAMCGVIKTGKVFMEHHPEFINQPDDQGRTALCWAAAAGQEDMVLLLLDIAQHEVFHDKKVERTMSMPGTWEPLSVLSGLWSVNVDTEDQNGRTPFWWAGTERHWEIVRILLRSGEVDVNKKDVENRALLSWAAENGVSELTEILLDVPNLVVDVLDRDGRTPFLLAGVNEQWRVVKTLLSRTNPDVNELNGENGTLLSYVAQKGILEAVQILLDAPNVQVDVLDKQGRTPLFLAGQNDRWMVVKMLLDSGRADVNAQNETGGTLLSWAARNGRSDGVEILLQSPGITVDISDSAGRTPLSFAAQNGHSSVVKLLLKTGNLDIDSRDQKMRTPLLWAAIGRQWEAVSVLLATGKVDVNAMDDAGQTPLALASGNGDSEVLRRLFEAGNIGIQDRAYWIPSRVYNAEPNTTSRRAFVLLVAINKYKNLPQLQACKRDEENVLTFLQSQFSDLYVISLVDEAATKEGIVTSIKSLSSHSLFQKHDPVIIHFSGHSSFMPRANHHIAELCPCDYDVEKDNGISAFHLRDLIKEVCIAADNLTIVLDCSNAEDLIAFDDSLTPDTHDELYNNRDCRCPSHRGSGPYPTGPIVLAGSRAGEIAREVKEGGWFTTNLIRYLNALGSTHAITYRDIERAFPSWGGNQTPVCVGSDKHRVLFDVKHRPYWIVDEAVYVDWGALHGAQSGSRMLIQSCGEEGTVEIAKVEDFISQFPLKSVPEKVLHYLETGQAAEISFPDVHNFELSIYVDNGVTLPEQVPPTVIPSIEQPKSDKGFFLSSSRHSGWSVIGPYGSPLEIPQDLCTRRTLEQISRFSYHLQRDLDRTPAASKGLKLELMPLDSSSSWKEVDPGLDHIASTFPRTDYTLRITAKSSFPLYLNVFLFEPQTYEIRLLNDSYGTISREGPDSMSIEVWRDFLPDPGGVLFFKVFVTPTRQDMRCLVQPSLFKTSQKAIMRPRSPPPWMTSVYRVHIDNDCHHDSAGGELRILPSLKAPVNQLSQSTLYAVLVGINDYTQTDHPRLEGSRNNVDSLIHCLKKHPNCNPAKLSIITLEDGMACRKEILAFIEEQFSRASSGDICFFHFSGHATPGAMKTYDAQDIGFADLLACRPKRDVKWVIHLDVCFGASFMPTVEVPDLTMLVASKSHELAMEVELTGLEDHTKRPMGSFTQGTVELLDKFPDLTPSSLVGALTAKNREQQPRVYGSLDAPILSTRKES